MEEDKKGLSRRDFLKTGTIGMAGLAGISSLTALKEPETSNTSPLSQQDEANGPHDHSGAGVVGQVDHEANGFNPLEI